MLATFEQPAGQTVQNISQSFYDTYFGVASAASLWIKGNSEALPLSTDPMQDGQFHVKSHKWEDFLVSGRQYELRQRFYKGTGNAKTAVVDIAYTFTCSGYTTQDEAPLADRGWVLTNRRVIADTTLIAWDTPVETVRFWLPFSRAVSGTLYTGCSAYEFDASACNKNLDFTRRFGNAGIIGATPDGTDPGASWAPHTNADPNTPLDLVYVHQGLSVYGATGHGMMLTYWIRPL